MGEYCLGDWIITKDGKLVIYDKIIILDDIERHATREEIIEGLKSGIIPFDNENFTRLLNKRMYFFVNSKLSPIQKGIQAGHAAVRYAVSYHNKAQEFIGKDETWIILDGGTSGEYYDKEEQILTTLGEMEEITYILDDNNIPFTYFHEPDLNDCLTAICLIVDERVFNRNDFPDFKEWALTKVPFINDANEAQLREAYENKMGTEIMILKILINDKKLAI